jgi:hypothetical protein
VGLLQNPDHGLGRQGENVKLHLEPAFFDIGLDVVNAGVERRLFLQMN